MAVVGFKKAIISVPKKQVQVLINTQLIKAVAVLLKRQFKEFQQNKQPFMRQTFQSGYQLKELES